MAEISTQRNLQPISPSREVWLAMRANRGAMVGLGIITSLILAAVFADFVAPHPYAEQYRDHFLEPPAWAEGGSWVFPLGTDDVGRCVLSRIIYGSRL